MGEEYSVERGRREGGEEVRRRLVPGRREGRGAISFIDFGPIDRPPLMEELMSVASERQGGRREDNERQGRPRREDREREGRVRTQQQRPAFPPVNRDHSGLARGEVQHNRWVAQSTIHRFLLSSDILFQGPQTNSAVLGEQKSNMNKAGKIFALSGKLRLLNTGCRSAHHFTNESKTMSEFKTCAVTTLKTLK